MRRTHFHLGLAVWCGLIAMGESSKAQTWNLTSAPSFTFWRALAASADGTKLIAADYGGPAYTSTNSGATWTSNSALPNLGWKSAASSADGTRLVMVSSSGAFRSTDSGATWASNNVPVGFFATVASSA